MGKYAKYEIKAPPKPEAVHPIWRGIGCLLMFLVPMIAYALSDLLLQPIIATGLVPYQLTGRIHFEDWTYQSAILRDIVLFIGGIDHLYTRLILFFVFLIILIGLFTTGYTAIYQQIGPKRYTGLDAPPPKVKTKEYKR